MDLKLYRVESSRVGLNVETFNLFYNVLIQKIIAQKSLTGITLNCDATRRAIKVSVDHDVLSTMETSR